MGRRRVVVCALGAMWMIGCSTPPVGAVATACPDAGVQPPPPASVCPACDENALCVGGICACNTGYAGDGEVCSAVPRGMPRETVLPSDFSEAIREVTLSADENVIAMAGSRTTVVHRSRDGWGPPQSIGRTDFAVLESSMALSADGSVLAATRNVAVATCNAADSGIAIYVRRDDLYGIETVISPPENQSTLAEPIALSADGNTLAALSFDRNLGEARAVLAGEEKQRGVQVRAGELNYHQLTFHNDHAFWLTADHEAAVPFFDQIAAVAKPGVPVTLADLQAVDPTAFKDAAGKALPWRSCLPSVAVKTGARRVDANGFAASFDPSKGPKEALRNYAEAMAYITSTQGHLNDDGLCAVKRNYESP